MIILRGLENVRYVINDGHTSEKCNIVAGTGKQK